MKILSTFILTTFIIVTGFSQTLTFTVNGLEDTEVNLVKYVGNKLYYADTANLVNGNVSFDASKQEPGIMALLLPGQQYFEFIYNGQDVNIETKNVDYVENMVVHKSKENKIFLDYIRYMKDQRMAANKLREERDALDESKVEEKAALNKTIDGMGEKVLAYQNKIVKDNPKTLVAQIVKMSTDVQTPEAPESQKDNENYKFQYYRAHYFDNIDFTDDRLVNTPILQSKLEYFYTKMMMQHPDTIIKHILPVVDQIPEYTTMYRFFVTNITGHFEKSKIMGMDKIWNTMIHRYYCAKDASGIYKGYWMDEEKLDELCKDTEKRMRIMIGDVPPNLILPDSSNNKWYSLYDTKAEYTILYFWDPNCGHCKKITPKLGELYNKKFKDRNIKIFSVGKATGNDFEDWKKFIKKNKLEFINVGVTEQLYQRAKENPHALIPSKTTLESINYQDTYDIYSTPRVFILDKDKKIIAKSLSIPQIEHMLDELQEGHKNDPKLFELDDLQIDEMEHEESVK